MDSCLSLTGSSFDRDVLVGAVPLLVSTDRYLRSSTRARRPLAATRLACGPTATSCTLRSAALADVVQIAIRFPADEIRHRRHRHLRLGGHAATAFGFKTVGQEAQAIGGGGKARQVQIEPASP